MKRKILTVCLIAALALTVVCLAACVKYGDEKTAEQLRAVNTLLRVQYSKMEMEVITQYEEVTLKANYILTKNESSTNIEYAVDRLNTIDVNNGVVTTPDTIKTRVKGTAVFNGSAVETIDGVALNPQILLDVADSSIMLRVTDLANVTFTENTLKATVTAPKNFMNKDNFDGTDMTVSVWYNESAITSLVINYKAADGAAVEMSYAFTK